MDLGSYIINNHRLYFSDLVFFIFASSAYKNCHRHWLCYVCGSEYCYVSELVSFSTVGIGSWDLADWLFSGYGTR